MTDDDGGASLTTVPVASIQSLIDTGNALLQDGDEAGACTSFRQAVKKALGLMGT